ATTSAATVNTISSSMNSISIYPAGSYLTRVSSLSPAPTSSAPLPLDQSTLQQIGRIDNSSFLLEAGRQSFLYFHLPGASALQSRTLESYSDIQLQNRANPTNFITGIAIRFQPSTNDDSIIIIPIAYANNSNSQTPGVFTVKAQQQLQVRLGTHWQQLSCQQLPRCTQTQQQATLQPL
ncbi:unnamed protein product, partial [Rotaria sp. Silwood2]